MGYYTNYTLNVYPENSAVSNDQICAAIDRMGLGFEGDMGWGFTLCDKWYDYEEDMLELSRKLPDVIFELYGDGESSDDFWICYFRNGEKQFCSGEIVYEECDLSREVAEIVKKEPNLRTVRTIQPEPMEDLTEEDLHALSRILSGEQEGGDRNG